MNKTPTYLVALALLAACGGKDDQQGAANGTTPDTTAATASAPQSTTGTDTTAGATNAGASTAANGAPTDPQIAAIVVAANNVDIEAGKLAQSKGTNPKVKDFAKQMVTDHTGVNKAATDLVNRLHVTPEENPTSQQLTQGGEQNRQSLQGKSGADFDRAYIANEVTYHQAVLDAIDKTLIPNAQNADLKALLQQTRPAVEAHLQHAKQIQSSLGQG